MVSYQYLYTFIALNFILLFAVFLSPGIISCASPTIFLPIFTPGISFWIGF